MLSVAVELAGRVVARRDGAEVGAARISREPGVVRLLALHADDAATGAALIAECRALGEVFEANVGSRVEDVPLLRLLRSAGLRHVCDAFEVTRGLDRLPPTSGFRLRPLAAVGAETFARCFARALAGTPNRYAPPPAQAWRQAVEATDATFAAEAWALVHQGDRPVGVLMPRWRPIQPERGSMAFVGLFPEARGRGLGPRLHALGLLALARRRARRYRDHTDIENHGMARAFAINGCEVVGVRQTFRG